MPCRATQDKRVMVKRSDKMSTGEGNGKPSFSFFFFSFTNMEEDTEEGGTGQATPADVGHGIRISLSV